MSAKFDLACPQCGDVYVVEVRSSWSCPTDKKHEPIRVTEHDPKAHAVDTRVTT